MSLPGVARRPRLDTSFVGVGELASGQKKRLFSLYCGVFQGCQEDHFFTDLDNKDMVLLITHKDTIVGFSTQALKTFDYNGEKTRIIFPGDTIVEQKYWGSALLPKTWLSFALSIADQEPRAPLYLLLLAGSFRTYAFLTHFLKDFFPRHGKETPQCIMELMDMVASEMFGGAFIRESGIIRFPHAPHLLGGIADILPRHKSNPDIAFYLEKNPGFTSGDELPCLAEISRGNLSKAGRRLIRR